MSTHKPCPGLLWSKQLAERKKEERGKRGQGREEAGRLDWASTVCSALSGEVYAHDFIYFSLQP
jgi:hypothetical protein